MRGPRTNLSRSRVLSVSMALALSLSLLAFEAPAEAQVSDACQSSSPASVAYTITVCISDPVPASILSGRTRITATTSVSSGGPSVSSVIFHIDGEYVLTDSEGERSFLLSSARWVDGLHNITARAVLSDGFTSTPAQSAVSFVNGTLVPPTRENTFVPTSGSPPAPGKPVVVAAVGDGAAGRANDRLVSDLITSWNPNMFLYLSDVYENGTFTEFENNYGDGTNYLSRLRSITNPAPGNHEYHTPGAAGYFDYWNGPPNYYEVTSGGWQIISLDSTSDFDQVTPGTEQFEWLRQRLQDPNPCKLVFSHHPRFSMSRGESGSLADLWTLMDESGVDVVLNGHDHNYQRWSPIGAGGSVDPDGPTQFVVGTGGKSVYKFAISDNRLAKGIDTAPDAYGALRMELNPEGLGYRYLNVAGRQLDGGSVACNPSTQDLLAPSTPADLTAVYNSGRVDLTWSASTDNVGVTGYEIYRNGVKIDVVPGGSAYSDGTAPPGAILDYEIRALDASGNRSEPTTPAEVTTPGFTPLIFGDDFETGSLSGWTSNSGLVVQGSEVFGGSSAARATAANVARYARKTLASPRSEIFYATRFKAVSLGSDYVYLTRIRSTAPGVLAGIFLTKYGELAMKNQVSGATLKTGRNVVGPGWHDLQFRLKVGSIGESEVWLDGQRLPELSGTGSFGTTAIGGIELGESATVRTFDFVFDDVAVADRYVIRNVGEPEPPDTTPPQQPQGLSATATAPTAVELSWNAPDPADGVASYLVQRNGVEVAMLPGTATSFTDATVASATTYSYSIVARDTVGNASPPSSPATVTTPAIEGPAPPAFADDFETGDLSKWSTSRHATVQTQHAHGGTYGARVSYSGTTGWVRKNLATDLNDLYYSYDFNVLAKGNTTMYLAKLRTDSNVTLGGAFLDHQNRLRWRNEIAAKTLVSNATIVKGRWYRLTVHTRVAGAQSLTEVWLDGVKVAALTGTQTLGAVPVGQVQLGESGSGHDVAFDDVSVTTP